MKTNKMLILSVVALGLTGCAGAGVKPEYDQDHKARDITTKIEQAGTVNSEVVGVRNGELIIQRKQLLTETLHDLQSEVYTLQATLYGVEDYRTEGMRGVLKSCHAQVSDQTNGGNGELVYTEPVDRIVDRQEELKIGFDEKKALVSVSEEYLSDRITRFQEYKKILLKRREQLAQQIDGCESQLKSQKFEIASQEVSSDE